MSSGQASGGGGSAGEMRYSGSTLEFSNGSNWVRTVASSTVVILTSGTTWAVAAVVAVVTVAVRSEEPVTPMPMVVLEETIKVEPVAGQAARETALPQPRERTAAVAAVQGGTRVAPEARADLDRI